MTPRYNFGKMTLPLHNDEVKSEINARCIEIWRRLSLACQEIGEASEANTGVVFFYPLQFVLSAWVYRKIEYDTGLEWPDMVGVRRQVFPFVDYNDVQEAINPDDKIPGFKLPSERQKPQLRKIIRQKIGIAALFFGRRMDHRVGLISPALPLRSLTREMKKAGLGLELASPRGFPHDLAVMHWTILAPAISEILDDFGATPAQREGLIEVLRRSIMIHTEVSPRPYSFDALVVGTMPNMDQRTSASAARRQGLPVVATMHGESHGVHDEPYFGYAEHSIATHVLGYGPAAEHSIADSDYLKPVIGAPPQLITCDSPIVRQLYEASHSIPSWPIDSGSRLLYVPTALSGAETYGPYRSAPDIIYSSWSQQMLNAFPNAQIKLHASEENGTIASTFPTERLVNGSLIEALEQCDGVIFDYISTAFTLAVATDKPILFLDLGLRHLSEQGRQAVEQRCVTLSCQFGDNEDLAERAVKEADGHYATNVYSTSFCLDSMKRSRAEALAIGLRNAVC